MGIFSIIKRKAKQKYEAEVAAYKDRAKFQKELTKKLLKARRESFEKEAIKQAAIRARLTAKLKFNPPKRKKLPILQDAIFFGAKQSKTKKQSKAAYDLIWKS